MNPADAKKILEEMCLDIPSKDNLFCLNPYISIYVDNQESGASLDGTFSADELEAIVAWMRDPEGVAGAK